MGDKRTLDIDGNAAPFAVERLPRAPCELGRPRPVRGLTRPMRLNLPGGNTAPSAGSTCA